MNVITIRRPRRSKKFHVVRTSGSGASKRLRELRERNWYTVAEVVLFGTMAVVSIWPIVAAAHAIIYCL
jgi:hypothetical protein